MFPTGSSPLTRGKPDFIRWTLMAYLAHPRSRGENFPYQSCLSSSSGSSPLTRGKLCRCLLLRQSRGLIPAHAGKTPLVARVLHLGEAHPRSRGENRERLIEAARIHGSSPLTRGKLGDRRPGRAGGGLIPAHAGKTSAY